MREAMMIMIDTNIVISALLSKTGPSSAVIKEIIEKGDTIVVCPYILNEVETV